MIHVHVRIEVKPADIEAFIRATKANVQASREEPGIVDFMLLQQADESSKFLLIEVYQSEEAVAEHKTTAHYLQWRETVAAMMAVPRSSSRFLDCAARDK